MPQSILELIFRTSKQGSGGKAAAAELKEIKGTVGELSSGLLGLNLASVGVIGVITGVAAGMKAAVTETAAYGLQVDDLARISGASAEETSRLIQTADDLRVEYSTLQQAAKALAKDGIALTTEELAKSADEYLAITDAGARAEYATTKFGKSGLELTKILEQGGAAIREMAAGQSEALIMTEAQRAAAVEFARQQDAVNDTLDGFKYTVGNAVLPAITSFLKGIDDLLNAEARLKAQQEQQVDAVMATAESYDEYKKSIEAINGPQARQQNALANQYGATTQVNEAVKVLTESEWNAVKAGEGMIDSFKREQMAVDNLKPALQDAARITDSLATDMQKYTEQLLFNQASAGLSAEASRALAASLGLIDEKTMVAMDVLARLKQQFLDGSITTNEYARAVANLNAQISGLQDKSVTITYNEEWNTTNSGSRRFGGEQYASGGSFTIPPGYENHTWPVGPGKWAQSGEEVIIKPKGGGGKSSGGAPLVGTVVINNGMDQAQFERMLMRATGR